MKKKQLTIVLRRRKKNNVYMHGAGSGMYVYNEHDTENNVRNEINL